MACIATSLVGRTLAHYQVLEELGAGGMGVVYVAEDRRLKRRVALKLLRPETAADEQRMKRFQQEAEIVASLNHPGIVTLFSVEEAEGLRFLTMELVDGKPLDELVPPGGMAIDPLLAVALPLAEAMAAAHERGVTHRDLKPANVIVTAEGRVKVLDFGLAKLREERTGAPFGDRTATTLVTQEGAVLGTVSYMSPEQAEGRAIGPPSDVFSLGILLYEMASGHRPFQGGSNIAVLSAVLKEHPQSLADARRDLPERLAAIVDRCLEKEAEARYATAGELLGELRALQGEVAGGTARLPRRRLPRWIPAAAGVALLALAGWWLATRGGERAAPGPALEVALSRVLVLPFADRSSDPDLASLRMMATYWLTQGMSRTGRLEVVPLEADLAQGDPTDRAWLTGVAKRTGAGTVVTGAYYLQGDAVQVSAQLYDTRSGELLTAVDPVSAPRSRPTEALEMLRQRLLGTLATFIDPELGPVAQLVSRPPSFAAYELFLSGMERYTAMDFRGALEPLKRAAAEDPNYSTPLLMAASAHYNLREYAEAQAILDELEPRRDTLAPLDRYNLEWLAAECRGDRGAALRAVRRAAELSPRSVWTFRQGVVALMSNRPGEARAAMETLDPEHGFVRGWISFSYHYASALHYLGEHQAELAQAEAARRGSPHSLGALGVELRARAGLGDVAAVRRLTDESVGLPAEWLDTPGTTMQLGALELAAHGQPAAAAELAARALAWHRALPPADAAARREDLGRSLLDAGELAEAGRVFTELAREAPAQIEYRGFLGVLAARRGDAAAAGEADRWLAALDRPYLFGEAYYWRAAIAAWSGRPDEALDLLRRAYAHGRPYHWLADQHLHVDPLLQPLRGEAGFVELLAPKG